MPIDFTIAAAAIVTVIAAIGGVTVQIINARSTAAARRDASEERRVASEERKALFLQAQQSNETAKDTSTKADKLIEKATGIEHMTNSTNSNLQKALELMTEKNAGLQKLMDQMESEKRTTASTRAVTDLQASAALHSPSPSAAPSSAIAPDTAKQVLKSIDNNTAATAANTERTESKVDALKDENG